MSAQRHANLQCMYQQERTIRESLVKTKVSVTYDAILLVYA